MPGVFPRIHSRSSQLPQVQGWRVGKEPQADVEPRSLQKPNACPLQQTCLCRKLPRARWTGRAWAASLTGTRQECRPWGTVGSLGPRSRMTREGRRAPCASPAPPPAHQPLGRAHPGHILGRPLSARVTPHSHLSPAPHPAESPWRRAMPHGPRQQWRGIGGATGRLAHGARAARVGGCWGHP